MVCSNIPKGFPISQRKMTYPILNINNIKYQIKLLFHLLIQNFTCLLVAILRIYLFKMNYDEWTVL